MEQKPHNNQEMTFTSFVGIVNSEIERGNITETTERKK